MDLSQSLPIDIDLTEAKTIVARPRSRSISAGTTPVAVRDRPSSAKSSLRLVRSRARPSSARVSRKNNSSNLPSFLLDKANDCRVGTQKIEAAFSSIKEQLATMTEAHRSMIERLNRLNAALNQLQNAHTCELLTAPELPAFVTTKPRATVTFAPEVLLHIVERRTSSTDTQFSEDDKSTAVEERRQDDVPEAFEVPNNEPGLSEVEEVFS